MIDIAYLEKTEEHQHLSNQTQVLNYFCYYIMKIPLMK